MAPPRSALAPVPISGTASVGNNMWVTTSLCAGLHHIAVVMANHHAITTPESSNFSPVTIHAIHAIGRRCAFAACMARPQHLPAFNQSLCSSIDYGEAFVPAGKLHHIVRRCIACRLCAGVACTAVLQHLCLHPISILSVH